MVQTYLRCQAPFFNIPYYSISIITFGNYSTRFITCIIYLVLLNQIYPSGIITSSVIITSGLAIPYYLFVFVPRITYFYKQLSKRAFITSQSILFMNLLIYSALLSAYCRKYACSYISSTISGMDICTLPTS